MTSGRSSQSKSAGHSGSHSSRDRDREPQGSSRHHTTSSSGHGSSSRDPHRQRDRSSRNGSSQGDQASSVPATTSSSHQGSSSRAERAQYQTSGGGLPSASGASGATAMPASYHAYSSSSTTRMDDRYQHAPTSTSTSTSTSQGFQARSSSPGDLSQQYSSSGSQSSYASQAPGIAQRRESISLSEVGSHLDDQHYSHRTRGANPAIYGGSGVYETPQGSGSASLTDSMIMEVGSVPRDGPDGDDSPRRANPSSDRNSHQGPISRTYQPSAFSSSPRLSSQAPLPGGAFQPAGGMPDMRSSSNGTLGYGQPMYSGSPGTFDVSMASGSDGRGRTSNHYPPSASGPRGSHRRERSRARTTPGSNYTQPPPPSQAYFASSPPPTHGTYASTGYSQSAGYAPPTYANTSSYAATTTTQQYHAPYESSSYGSGYPSGDQRQGDYGEYDWYDRDDHGGDSSHRPSGTW